MKREFPSPETRYKHHVSYGETDQARVMYYGEYFHLFERARSQLIREQGMSYAEAEERGLILPVREARCRYRRPARYDELLTVRCAVSVWGRASITFVYEVLAPDGETLLAEGETEHACVGPEGRPVRVPEWLKELFGQA